MKEIKTASGFECSVDEGCFNDIELFEALIDLENKKIRVLPEVLRKILKEDKQRLYEHVRQPDGIVPMDAVMNEVMEIVAAAGGKN